VKRRQTGGFVFFLNWAPFFLGGGGGGGVEGSRWQYDGCAAMTWSFGRRVFVHKNTVSFTAKLGRRPSY